MEQGPRFSYEQTEEGESVQLNRQSPESQSAQDDEVRTESHQKSFEKLVSDSLKKELKYERDPGLRHRASQRADAILAESQDARQTSAPLDSPIEPTNNNQSNGTSQEKILEQLGLKDHLSKSSQARTGFGLNLGLADLMLGLVIVALLLIVIFLLA